MESIYENLNKSAIAFINQQNEFLLIQLIGGVSRKHYKGVLKASLDEAIKANYNKIIFNVRDMKTNPDIGRRWFTTHFLLRLYKSVGEIQLAVITPQNVIERKSITFLSKLISQIGIEVRIRFFDEVIEAQNWLINEPLKAERKTALKEARKESNHWFYRFLRFFKSENNEEEEWDNPMEMDNWETFEEIGDTPKSKSKPKKIVSWKKSRFKFKVYFDKNGKLK